MVGTLRPSAPPDHTLAWVYEAIGAGADPLGDAFARLRSPRQRRPLGATYTPGEIVSAMLEWAEREGKPTRIVDPGSGSGRFAVAAGRRFPQAEIAAVEIDPVAAIVARGHLAAAGLAERSRLNVADYRSYCPERIAGQTLYVGNPPYVRHHEIEPAWKQWLAAEARTHGHGASRLSGLHVHFFLATAIHAAPGDYGAFVTSAEWLDVNYGSLIRELVLDGLGGRSIHLLEPAATPFEDAATTAAITCFRIGDSPSALRLRRVRTVADLGGLEGGRPVARERLASARRWTPLTRRVRRVPAGYVELGEICRVHRGAVTGANDVWVAPPGWSGLPERVLFPAVTRARELFDAGTALSRTDRLSLVVDLPVDLDLLTPDERVEVEHFLRVAASRGAARGYVARHRLAWWSVGLRPPAPILATYMARRPPVFVRNPREARHINIAHGLYPREPIPDGVLDVLAAHLTDTASVDQGRVYAGGLTKFEPKEMERLPVPDLTALTALAAAAASSEGMP